MIYLWKRMCFFALNREDRVSLQPSTFNPLIFALPWHGSLTLGRIRHEWASPEKSFLGRRDISKRDERWWKEGSKQQRSQEFEDIWASRFWRFNHFFLPFASFLAISVLFPSHPSNPRCTTWAAARDAIVAAPPAASLECLEAGQAAQCCQRAGAGRTGHGGHDWGCFIYPNHKNGDND